AIDVAGGLDFTGDAGSCPASPTATVFGKTVTVSIEPACAFAGILRPLVLIIASLAAGGIIMGGFRT
ncbi:MAG: virulence factor TspB C-terminal domain-related protein, partial [Pseudomonadota bacterium]